MEKKPRRQGDVTLNVILGVYKQKGCTGGNTVITKLQFFWGVRIWGVLLCRTFQAGTSVHIVREVNVKLSLGNRRYSSTHSLPRHGVQASGHVTRGTRRVGWVNPKSRSGRFGERQGPGIACFVLTGETWRSLKLRFHAWRPNVVQPIKTWRECYIFHKYSFFLFRFWRVSSFEWKLILNTFQLYKF